MNTKQIIKLKKSDIDVIKTIAKATKMDAWAWVDDEGYIIDVERGKRLKTKEAVVTLYEGLEFTMGISSWEYFRFMQILYQLTNHCYLDKI